ncbi:hypothetical protein FHS15_001584 [Paenibacillus castaneae]|uniref:phosphotransferase n=1 Tax=Paenibacillus castaneae TaxID=474957 RepID=UPI000C9CBC83|nr:phosphotransferase [Paenibacillus castaneae]NIK76459.1 hypothetical protein [Paenibacillus castaneae]
MKSKYHIDESILMMQLTKEYGVHIVNLCFIPFGDSAYSYQVNGLSGERFYLKLFDHENDSHRRGIIRLSYYLPLTWSIYHQGLFQNLTYPIKTLTDEFIVRFSDCTFVLFHFIEGQTLASAYPFSNKILKKIGISVAQIQQLTPYIDRSMLPIETYDVSFVPELEKCLSLLENTKTFNDYIQQSLKEKILTKKRHILVMINLIHELKGIAMADPKEWVLCHGDLWGGNMILQENEMYLIDWESVLIAPPELDLVGYIGEEFNVFFSAYEQQLGKSVTINLDVLRFYAYRHHLRNLTNWLMNILYRNLAKSQKENDLDMIIYHCMNRWDDIEPDIKVVDSILKTR